MSFLQPILLLGLPLAALPIIIHLIHLRRRRTVPWAAMIFLLAAQKMNKGFSKLRQWLILASRVVAIMALIFLVSRPLAGGLLGLTGGAPDTVIVLLDRSASMEQLNLSTGTSKRAAGVSKLSDAIRETVGNRSRLVLIDSAQLEAREIENPEALIDHPQAGPTGTAADLPELLQAALDYISVNQTGRTDVWVLSDMRRNDWDAVGGRWQALRGAFASLQGVRFHLLTYAQPAEDNLGVTVERILRREGTDKAELLVDVRISRFVGGAEGVEVPIRFVVNGVSSALTAQLEDTQLVLQGHRIPLDKATKRGWGRVEIPGDTYPADNVFHFVFDDAPVLKAVIVSDEPAQAGPLKAVLASPADASRKYEAEVLKLSRAAEIAWEETALVVWQAPIPGEDDILRQQLANHVAAGRVVIFLPPDDPGGESLMGLSWGEWSEDLEGNAIEWWRSDSGLLANTRSGTALPLGELELLRRCAIVGEGAPMARTVGGEPVLVKAVSEGVGGAYFLGTLPGPGVSSLARDGVVMFALMHRALDEGGKGLGKAQQRWASRAALGGGDLSNWKRLGDEGEVISSELAVQAGVLEEGDRLVALNRPPGEDRSEVVGRTALEELFAGLDYQILEETVEDTRSLASEVWRTFLVAMAIALLVEALLCMPAKRKPVAVERGEKRADERSGTVPDF